MSVTETNGTSDSEWIAAHDALKLLRLHHGGSVPTKIMLAEALKDDELHAHADRLWASDAPSLTTAWKQRAQAEAEEDVEVAADVWTDSRYWREDLDLWRWTKNRFIVTHRKKPGDRTIIEGVKFRRSEIEALLPAKSRAGVGGPKISPADWEKIGVALVKMAHMGVFQPVGATIEVKGKPYTNVTEFADKIGGLTDHAYGRSQAHKFLVPIYRYFHPET